MADDKCIWKKVCQLTLLLPTVKVRENEYQPDYAYMHEYMKKIEGRVKSAVDLLTIANKV